MSLGKEESKQATISISTLAVVLLVFGTTPSSVKAGRLPFGVVTSTTTTTVETSIGTARRTTRLLHEAFVPRSVLLEKARLDQLPFHSSSTTSSTINTWQRIPRGGATAAAASAAATKDEEDEDNDVAQEEVDESEEEQSDVEEEEDESEGEEDRTETASADDSSQHPLESVMSMKPLAVLVKTSLGNAVLDTSIELTVNRSRNIRSIKESLRRQLPGRPPIQAMELVYQGKRLAEHMLVDELIDDEEEEEDDDEQEEGETSDYQLVLQLDMVPPVDPKFVPQLEQHIQDLTASELLDAYAANEAALYQNAAFLMQPSPAENEEGDGDDEEESTLSQSNSLQQQQQQQQQPLVSMQIREQATRIRQDLEDKLLHTTHAQKLLANPVPPSAQQEQSLTATQVRGDRVRRTAVAGVRTSIKQKVQHNLNIEWAESIRNFTLFLFFGWFGGRTPLSRAILLLGAPSVFVLQARPVKLWIKQLLYAILDHPPSIVLSLLPAPQQAILSLHMVKSMKALYGDTIASEYYDRQADDDEGGDALSATPLGPKRVRLVAEDVDDDEDDFLLDDDDDDDDDVDDDDDEEEEVSDYEDSNDEEDED